MVYINLKQATRAKNLAIQKFVSIPDKDFPYDDSTLQSQNSLMAPVSDSTTTGLMIISIIAPVKYTAKAGAGFTFTAPALCLELDYADAKSITVSKMF